MYNPQKHHRYLGAKPTPISKIDRNGWMNAFWKNPIIEYMHLLFSKSGRAREYWTKKSAPRISVSTTLNCGYHPTLGAGPGAGRKRFGVFCGIQMPQNTPNLFLPLPYRISSARELFSAFLHIVLLRMKTSTTEWREIIVG